MNVNEPHQKGVDDYRSYTQVQAWMKMQDTKTTLIARSADSVSTSFHPVCLLLIFFAFENKKKISYPFLPATSPINTFPKVRNISIGLGGFFFLLQREMVNRRERDFWPLYRIRSKVQRLLPNQQLALAWKISRSSVCTPYCCIVSISTVCYGAEWSGQTKEGDFFFFFFLCVCTLSSWFFSPTLTPSTCDLARGTSTSVAPSLPEERGKNLLPYSASSSCPGN